MADFIFNDEVFYHGTRAKFDRFRPLSHFGSWEAATDILASSCTIKTEKLDGLTEIKSSNKPPQTPIPDSIIIPAKLNINNTYEIQDFASCHDLKSYKGFVLRHIAHDLQIDGAPKFFDYIFTEPFSMPCHDVQNELIQETLYTPEFEEIDRYHLSFQRIIQYFEALGYDGFHYINQYEDRGHTSYIVFRPENIIRMDKKNQEIPTPTYIRTTPKILPVRKRTDDEQARLYFENINHDDLFEQKVTNTQPSLMPEYADKLKAHYAKIFYHDILPKIRKISTQPEYGYHGLTHTEQTVLYGLDIAITCGHDPLPVMLACAMHDIRRKDNTIDTNHGANAVPFVRKFISENYPRLHLNTIEEIIGAIKHHSDGQIARHDLTSACMWDADRIRMAWDGRYNASFFSTMAGRQLAELGADAQKKYMHAQKGFLVRHNIKTAEQIAHEQQMQHIAVCHEFKSKCY